MNDEQKLDVAAMIRGGAEIVTKLLENSTPEAAESVTHALNSGASIGIKLDVIPRPMLRVILTEHEGVERVLAEFVLEPRASAH
jgi:hypothetical protein